jgi:hypothetical protein
MKLRSVSALLLTFALIVFGSVGGLCLASCTPRQRTVLRTVIDTVEQVCPDAMTVEECLRRADLALAPTASPSAEPSAVASSEPAGMPPGMGSAASTAKPVAP